MLTDMVKFIINPIALLYSGDKCKVTIAAFIVISATLYSRVVLGARTSTMSCSLSFYRFGLI